VDAAAVGDVDRIGTVVAERYRIVEFLGQGAMGSVYRAMHLRIARTFAVKVLHPELSLVSEMVARFEREAIAAGRINHPNVAAAIDFGRLPDGAFFLVLEFVSGTSLRTHLETHGPLSTTDALAITRQIASALVAAHGAGVVHRDLKPENVMLVGTDEGSPQIKVLDFGIAKLTRDSDADGPVLTRMGTVFGTPEYMSPEQAGGSEADARSDLYSLGIILYELLTGKTPFCHTELVIVLTRQMNAPPPPLPETVPLRIRRLVESLLEKRPEQRPARAEIVESLLNRLLTESRPPPPPLPRSRFRGGVWLRSLVLGLVILLTVLVALRRHQTESTAPPSPSPSLAQLAAQATARWVQRAMQGDLDCLAQLEKSPAESRTPPHWLAIGHGRAYNREWEGVLVAYEHAVDQDPTLLSDRRLVFNVSQAAYRKATSRHAIDFALTRLGSTGLDLVFAVADAAAGGRAPEADQKYAKAQLDVFAKGTSVGRPLRAYFALRDARSCADTKRALVLVAEDGDSRAQLLLRRLTVDHGCGLFALADCYPCLRTGGELKAALAAAKQRPAPDFSFSSTAPSAAPAKVAPPLVPR
jgi:serine/threonine protein kinase